MTRKALFAIGLALCLGLAMTGPVYMDEPLTCPPQVIEGTHSGRLIAEKSCTIAFSQIRGKVEVLENQTTIIQSQIYGDVELASFSCLRILANSTLSGHIKCDFPSFLALSRSTIVRGNVDENCILVSTCSGLNETEF